MTFPAVAGQRLTTALINHAYSLADANVTTVTATSATNLSSIYDIPANDAATGTVYELVSWGNGTWGSTTHNLFLYTALAGSVLGAGSEISSNLFNASQVFRWRYTARLICVTPGTSGTWYQQGDGVISCYSTALNPGTAASNTTGFGDSTSATTTQDTTAANTFAVWAQWGGTTCSITCHGTKYTRCG